MRPNDHVIHSSSPPFARVGDYAFLLIGFLAFCLVANPVILNPTHVAWLTFGDQAQHWLGWQFFRQAPLWQFPFGMNDNWGMELGGSVVFTDSIPLLAMALKPISSLLPRYFQYFGPWILVCFVLQAYFADRLARLFTRDRVTAALLSVLFVLAPPMLWRLHGHVALFSHWLLLAGLYLYCAPRFRPLAWGILSGAAVLVHGYLFGVVYLVFLADLAHRALARESKPVRLALVFSANTAWVLLLMATAGYFSLGGEVGLGGFGVFRLNLDSLFNSYGKWSLLFPGLPEKAGDYEGFNYLGLGGMLVVAAGAASLALPGSRKMNRAFVLPLVVLFVFLFVFAVSNRIAFSTRELFHYDLGRRIEAMIAPFRASGRFFWLGWYMLLLGGLSMVRSRLGRSAFLAFALAVVAAQCADISPALRYFHHAYANPAVWESPLRSPAWDLLSSRYRKLIRVLPKNNTPDWLPFSSLAMSHGMRTNFGYFARFNSIRVDEARETLAHDVLNDALPADSLYVLDNDVLWFMLLARRPTGYVGVVDGYRIYAPGLPGEEEAELPHRATMEAFRKPFLTAPGTVLRFVEGENGMPHLDPGWAYLGGDVDGSWSMGDLSGLALALEEIPDRAIDIRIVWQGFVVKGYTAKQRAFVSVNDGPEEPFVTQDDKNHEMRLRVSPETLRASRGVITVKMRFPDCVSPFELGLNPFRGRMACCIKSLRIDTVRTN